MRDQVRDDFGIGGRAKHVAELLQLISERGVILDHAVMHQDHFAVAPDVGMGIDVRGFAVGRPAGVPDSQRALDRLFFKQTAQFIHPPGFFANRDFTFVKYGHARAVVAAIFQAVQTFQNQFRRRPMPDVSHNPAHTPGILFWS